MHITTHSAIDREKSVGELIDEGADLTVRLQKHYANPYGSFPDRGQFTIRANRDIWIPFSIKEAFNLPEVGALFEETNQSNRRPSRDCLWVPGVFITRVEASDAIDPSHREEIGTEVIPETVVECGVGQIYGENRYKSPILAATSLVLRKSVLAGEGQLSVRAYVTPYEGAPDELAFAHALPEEEVCKDLLQLHRNAMWNTVSEPA